jgi:hypothetical protein
LALFDKERAEEDEDDDVSSDRAEPLTCTTKAEALTADVGRSEEGATEQAKATVRVQNFMAYSLVGESRKQKEE